MLDVKTLKILRFLNEHPDETFSSYQMEKCGVSADGETLDWLYKHDMVSRYQDEDGYVDPYDGPDYIYQINAGGRVALEEQQHFVEVERRAVHAETRADESLRISKFSLAVAVIAIIAAWLK